MDVFKKALMILGGLWLLGLASCTVLGIGGMMAVGQASSEFADAASEEIQERSVEAHNERMNREAYYESEYESAGY